MPAQKTETLIDFFSFQDALAKLDLDPDIEAAIKANRAFRKGDHWQDGDAWIGPHPADGNPDAVTIMNKFRRVFVSKNVIAEITKRQRNAVAGRPQDWTITVNRALERIPAKVPDPEDNTKEIDDPSGAMVDAPPTVEEQELIDEANAAANLWWDRQEVLKVLQAFTDNRINFGKAALRPFVPPDSLSASGRVDAKTVEEAILHLYVETPEPEDAVIFTHKSSMKRLSVLRIVETDESGNETVTLELSALTSDGRTVIATRTKDSDEGETPLLDVPQPSDVADATPETADADESDQSQPLALGGRLALHVVEGEPLISEQVRQNQKLLNLALTMCGHNVVEAGFSERVTANAELPGKMVPDPTAEGGQRFVPDPLPRGAGVTTNLMPLQYTDENGATRVMEPKVYYRDPAPVDTFIQTKELALRDIYEETHQLHAMITGDATASGESRIQALADFVMSCLDIKEAVDTGGRYLIETAIHYAAQLAGTPDRYKGLRVNFDAKIDTGPMSPDERRALQDEVAKRLRSRKSYMVITGESDPDAALVDIKREEELFPKVIKVSPLDPKNNPTPPPKKPAVE